MPRRSNKITADQEALIDALAAASRAMVALASRSLAGYGVDLTLPQYRALVVLAAARNSLRSAEFAHALAVAPSTVTRLCDRLERRGLIRRAGDADDRRSVTVQLTEAGRELIAGVMRARRAMIADLVREWDLRGDQPAASVVAAFVAAVGEPSEAEWRQALTRAAKRVRPPAKARPATAA